MWGCFEGIKKIPCKLGGIVYKIIMPKSDGFKNLELGRGWNKGRDTRIQLKCPVCGKLFRRYKNKIKSKISFCSPKCAYKGRSLGFTKRKVRKPYNRKFKKEKRICPICQKEFIYNKKTQIYCSRKCFEISHKFRMRGENNPSYKNGNSYKKRSWRGDDWETLRKEIYKRDNYICQDCGIKCISKREATKKNSDRIIQCHHIEKKVFKKSK
ncbi:MAG: hypothetical protein J7L46_05520 [Bacteroidales bacterium]|nr:hypothetical protein [Bacteroidales bacterium]